MNDPLTDPMGVCVTRSGRELTWALARALGLPKTTVWAVLTLNADEPPMLDVTMLATDGAGNFIVESVPSHCGEGVDRRIAKVHFMLRLERFPEAGA